MQDKTINNALLALRKQMIRGDGDGLAHVEALLVQRGVDMPRVMPAKRNDVARRMHMRSLVLQALEGGPARLADVVAYVHPKYQDVPIERTSKRVSNALWKAKLAGLVGREGRLWRLSIY
jgi:hypothetical protein